LKNFTNLTGIIPRSPLQRREVKEEKKWEESWKVRREKEVCEYNRIVEEEKGSGREREKAGNRFSKCSLFHALVF